MTTQEPPFAFCIATSIPPGVTTSPEGGEADTVMKTNTTKPADDTCSNDTKPTEATTTRRLNLVSDSTNEDEAEAPVAGDTLLSIVEMLSKSPEWIGVLAWNEFEQRIVFRKDAPFADIARSGGILDDEDVIRICLWFEKEHHVEVKKAVVVDAIRIVASRSRFHPVRDHLTGVTWDGTSRVDTWLETFLGVKPTSKEHERMVRSVARKWLISCVARAMNPGCKVDTMLILEGRQGIGKSTALKALAGKEFFSDSLIDFKTKDACQSIQGVWIFELSELDALVRAETSTAKAFLTRSSDKFRAPYGRVPTTVPRSTVFCGTVNESGYLKDQSGNRRFWVVRCGDSLDVAGLSNARDQIWAEAVALFEKGELWHLTAVDELVMREGHEDRLVVDPWQEQITEWVATHGEQPFAIEAVLEGVLNLKAASRNPPVTRRVHHILERLGFERQRKHFESGRRGYRYVRSAPPPSPTASLPYFAPSNDRAPAKRSPKTAPKQRGTVTKKTATTKATKMATKKGRQPSAKQTRREDLVAAAE